MKIYGLDELGEFAGEVARELGSDGIVLLRGDLASGKSTFVRKFVESIGLHVEVSSPTFSVMHEYGERVCHYDIYQNGVDGFLQSGLLEKLDEPKYHLVEWADDRFEEILVRMGFNFLRIDITTVKDKRGYKCTQSK